MKPIIWNKDSDYREIESIDKLPSDFGPLCGLDVETSPLQQLDILTSRPYSIQVSDRPGRAWLVKGEVKAVPFLKELFARDYRIIIQNGKTDLAIYENCGLKPRMDDDLMLMSFIANPNDRHGLKVQAAKRLFVDHPEWSKEYYSQPTIFKAYACGDAELLVRLYPLIKPEVNERAYKLEMAIVPVLMSMERLGVNIDQARVQELLKLIERAIVIVKAKIFKMSGCEFELDSHAQVADIVYGKMGIECKKKTRPTSRYPEGQRSTSKLAFKGLEHHDIIRLVELYRRLEKRRGTYVAPLPDYIKDDGRVHTEFLQHVTPTLRLACTKPNMMNQPKVDKSEIEKRLTIRDVFIPAPGHYFLDVDFKQIEFRLMIFSSKVLSLIRRLEAKEDFHITTAADVIRDGAPRSSIDKKMREDGKTFNYALSYGMDDNGYRSRKNCSREEAKAVMMRFNREYDGLPQFFEQERRLALEKGGSRTFLGPLRQLEDLHSSEQRVRDRALRNALNDQIQGGAAQIFKYAMVRLFKQKPDWLKMLVPVHDEILCEVPNEVPPEKVIPILKEALEVDLGTYGTYPIEVAKGDCWSRCEEITG